MRNDTASSDLDEGVETLTSNERRIATLRAQGVGWKRFAAGMGVGVGTIYRVVREGSKTREKVF
jgi:hypothetical protein